MFSSLLSVPYIVPFLACSAISALILWGLLRSGLAWSLATDMPTDRSLHTKPTPRVGGWGVTPASVIGILCFAPQLGWAGCGACVLAALSQVDDRRGLSARLRFAVQLLTAIALCGFYPPQVSWWVIPVLVIGLVWMSNLYNFMDGADGLAGGMALIGFVGYAFAAISFAPSIAVAALAVAGAASGFLLFNFPPAKLFLGDAGSVPLGFLAGAFGLIGWTAHIWPIWFPLWLFLPFIADATVTLLRRLARGEPFWKAHREHFYQRMIRMDDGHTRTILAWYALMLTNVLLGLLALNSVRAQATLFALFCGVVWVTVLAVLGWRVDARWAKFEQVDKNS